VVRTRAYAGESAEDRRSGRQDRLFQAAFELLASDGVAGLTIRKVAAAAGVSTRYVYESFDNLEDLRTQAFDRAATEVASQALKAIGGADTDLVSQLKALLGALIRFASDEPQKTRLLLTDSFGDPALADRRQQMTETFAEGFALYVRFHLPESVPDQRVSLAARMLVGATAETFTARIHGALDYSDSELLDDMVDLFVGAIESLPSIQPLYQLATIPP
jgi:AcrR family transcriptional regulator